MALTRKQRAKLENKATQPLNNTNEAQKPLDIPKEVTEPSKNLRPRRQIHKKKLENNDTVPKNKEKVVTRRQRLFKKSKKLPKDKFKRYKSFI